MFKDTLSRFSKDPYSPLFIEPNINNVMTRVRSAQKERKAAEEKPVKCIYRGVKDKRKKDPISLAATVFYGIT